MCLPSSQGEGLDLEAWPGVLLDVERGGAGSVAVVEGADGVEWQGLGRTQDHKGHQASLETFRGF